MRFIVLQSFVTPEGNLVLNGLESIVQKASGAVPIWIEFSQAKTNCIEPDKCDLLSFTDKDELQENLESWGMDAENIAILGVEAE